MERYPEILKSKPEAVTAKFTPIGLISKTSSGRACSRGEGAGGKVETRRFGRERERECAWIQAT